MQATALFEGDALSVFDYRCDAGPSERPFAEVGGLHSVSYVRRGSFGCRTLGEAHELVAGAVLVVRPGREYTATHEHHGCGDECLSFQLSPGLADSLGAGLWDLARLPPLPELMVFGELAQAAADGRATLGLDEAAFLFIHRASQVASGGVDGYVVANGKRKMVETALWLEENAGEEVSLETAARQAGLSPFHFLRTFARVVGATPHQYLLRARLRRAARLLSREDMPVTEVALESGFADLSNFVRAFGRAAGVSPRAFRKAAQGDRKIYQERAAALA